MSKKYISMVSIFDSFIFAFMGAVSCSCATPNFVVWCQDRIRKSTFHKLLWHVWKHFFYFRCVQEGLRTHSYSLPSVRWWEFLEPAWHKFSECQVRRSKFRGRFDDSNSTHYWSFWLPNVDQSSRDLSLWSHFLPFFTCKYFQNEVRLPHIHGHPKMLYAT